jgi:hypothetical protein
MKANDYRANPMIGRRKDWRAVMPVAPCIVVLVPLRSDTTGACRRMEMVDHSIELPLFPSHWIRYRGCASGGSLAYLELHAGSDVNEYDGGLAVPFRNDHRVSVRLAVFPPDARLIVESKCQDWLVAGNYYFLSSLWIVNSYRVSTPLWGLELRLEERQ